MADIAVRCRKCRKVTHWLTNFKKIWLCPECRHAVNSPVLDGRDVAHDDDKYTEWRTECGHDEMVSPFRPINDSRCSECKLVRHWYKYRDLDQIVPSDNARDDKEHKLVLNLVNLMLDRLVEKK